MTESTPMSLQSVGQCLKKAREARERRLYDQAEEWLNVVARIFRTLGLRNTSQNYRQESRALAHCRVPGGE